MKYVELEVGKEFRSLVYSVCKATMQLPIDSVYKLTSWLRRCALAVPSHISRVGSIYESGALLYLALDQKYVMQTNFDWLRSQIKNYKKLINGFINYCKSSNK
ncbi:four helix bundle protein [uncultured Kriegella sp.]|uniref:four helix bundle protein n=1 Tax=uncultured Kriegella sp. TaxID=1798910 RepID=UPI0030D93BF7|tara:strand:- start:157101 stop:157409 length:309 start_codon:yes stop_codon:yes gene_type:complete